MNGELLPVWSRSWQEVWLRLSKYPIAPNDLFIELVGSLANAPQQPASPPQPPAIAFDADGSLVDLLALQAREQYELALTNYAAARSEYESALTSEALARRFFRKLLGRVKSEAQAVEFFESAHAALVGYGNPALLARFDKLVSDFVRRYSLRYELRGDSLRATIPGVFAKLISELKKLSIKDDHLRSLLNEFEESFGDLKTDRTQAKIKTCLQKQFNLLEALGQKYPGVSETTLGAICNQLDWPHATIKEVGKKLYGFRSSYPGLGHAGNADSVLRQLDMRDFISLSLMLASFTPYVAHDLNSDQCYTA